MSFRGFFGLKENHSRRHYDHQQQQSGVHSPSQFHRPSSGGYPVSPQVPPGRTTSQVAMFDRVNESNTQPPVSTQFFQKMIILHDHYPKREMELSVRKGEKVEVVKKETDWLFVRNERGKEGYVPSRNCVAPVTRRSRSNSRSSVPIRPVMSGEVLEGANGRVRSGSGVPMYSSSSAGKVRRYDSPMSVCDFDRDNNSTSTASFQRIGSPPSILYTNEPSTEHTTFDTKCSLSSSSGVSLMDTSSPGLTRAFSHEELKQPYTEVHSMYSLSQSAVDPSINGDNKPIIELRNARHKHSSSDDSGTVDSTHLRDPVDYASTIRNDESSTEDVNLALERIPSGGTMTPSMRDRPLPSPPKSNGTSTTTTKEETPPPIPPRNTSLDTSRLRGSSNVPPPVPPPTEDDRNPYAQPVDSISNGSDRGREGRNQRVHSMLQKQQQQQQQHHQGGSIRAIIDISEQNSGVDAPYSEVYRSERRPINVHELRDSPLASKKLANGKSKHRSSSGSSIARKNSPLVNGGSDHNSGDEVGGKPEGERRHKGIAKFRKNLWGVFICMKDFDGIDENEVSVRAGEQVLVFNQDDQFWYWVVKHKTDQSEGFVPASILREDDKKLPSNGGDISIGSNRGMRSTRSPPAVPPRNDSRQRVHTVSSSLLSSASVGGNHTHRNRVRSISSVMSNTNSIEKVPIDSDILRTSSFGPSSPPPPYAEQDPILHPHSSQSHDKHMTSNNHSVQQGGSGIIRNRPPTYPRSGRSSTSSQMYPPPSPGSGVYPGYVSQSASRLNHPHGERFYQEHQNSYPCSPVASTGGGGTLV